MTDIERFFNYFYGISLFLKKPKQDKNGNPQYLTAAALKRLDEIKYEERYYSALGIVRYEKIIDAISKTGATLFSVSENEITESIGGN